MQTRKIENYPSRARPLTGVNNRQAEEAINSILRRDKDNVVVVVADDDDDDDEDDEDDGDDNEDGNGNGNGNGNRNRNRDAGNAGESGRKNSRGNIGRDVLDAVIVDDDGKKCRKTRKALIKSWFKLPHRKEKNSSKSNQSRSKTIESNVITLLERLASRKNQLFSDKTKSGENEKKEKSLKSGTETSSGGREGEGGGDGKGVKGDKGMVSGVQASESGLRNDRQVVNNNQISSNKVIVVQPSEFQPKGLHVVDACEYEAIRRRMCWRSVPVDVPNGEVIYETRIGDVTSTHPKIVVSILI